MRLLSEPIQFLELELADGVTANVMRELLHGRFLVYVTLGFGVGSVSSAIDAYVALQTSSTPAIHMNLVGGWIWHPPTASHKDDPVWIGRIRIPDVRTDLRLEGTNETGLTKTIRCEYILEEP